VPILLIGCLRVEERAQKNARISELLTPTGRAGADRATIPRAGVQISAQNITYDCGRAHPHRRDCARIPWFIVHPIIKMLSSGSPAGPDIYAQPLDQ